MKIAFLNGDVLNLNDGYHKLSKEAINALSEKHSVHVISFQGKDAAGYQKPEKVASYEMIVEKDETLKRIYQFRSLLSKESMISWHFRSMNIDMLNERLKELDPDILIVNHIRSGWVLPYLTKDINPKTVYIAHNCESLAYKTIAELQTNKVKKNISLIESGKMYNLEKQILERVDSCVALTQEDADRLKKIDSNPKFVVIPPGINKQKNLLDTDKSLSLLLVGSYKWEPKKRNALWLANEVLPLINQGTVKIKLKIVGIGADELQKSIKYKDMVEIYSDVESTMPFFEGNNIFIIPERQQGGFKLKTIEAASFGLPIVSTSAGIEGSGLKDGESCVIADTKEEFVEKVRILTEDTEKRNAIGQAAWNYVSENFQEETIRNKYLELMESLKEVTV